MSLLLWQLFLVQWVSVSAISTIDPSKLLVATIIDPHVERILKDSRLLFQSIRLFGGSLNDATLLACLVVDKDRPFHNDSLIASYLELGVVVDFVPRVANPLPGTMNKFSTMEHYDSSRFDYFLWLDADVVVFDDPIALLSQRYQRGSSEIQCVPEMYNYMSRFPKVNQSELFWNPSLSRFVLADDDLIAPHGVCNTGVLFFTSQSLTIFLATLHSPTLAQLINAYPTDRFLDSLCFVAIVNLVTLHVEPLDYALNYMAFLEIYIERLKLTSHDPIFVHFIANSTLECSAEESCSCLYVNDEIVSKESKIIQLIQNRLLPIATCRILADVDPLPVFVTPNEVSQTHNQIDSSSNIIEDHETDDCFMSIFFPSPEMIIFYDFNEVTLYLILKSLKCLCSISIREFVTKQVLLSDAIDFPSDSSDRSLLLVEFPFPQNLISPNGINRVELKLSTLSLHLVLVCQSKLTNGFRTYSLNYMMNQLPLSLQSQVLLPEYLNTRKLTCKGLVICCGTLSGVRVVENLIAKWGQNLHDDLRVFNKNPLLIILLKSVPSQSSTQFETLTQLTSYLSTLCQRSDSRVSCVIVQELGSKTTKTLFLNRNNFLNFVYLDTVDSSFPIEMDALTRWYHALSLGGLLIGTQYTPPALLKEFSEKYSNDPRYNQLILRSAAVENFAFLQRNSPLFTSHESFFASGDDNDPFAFLPAWYLLKQERVVG